MRMETARPRKRELTMSECQLVLLERSSPRYSLNLSFSASRYTNHIVRIKYRRLSQYLLTNVEFRIAFDIA
jgi:hypothetical protein